jgi:hypothetical protein
MANDTRGQNPIQLSSKNLAFLTLDSIINSAFFFAGKWHPDLKRNQSRDVLRALLYKLFAPRGGSLFHRHARCSHAALAEQLSLSREWTCTLISRLRSSGWIETSAPRLSGSQQQDISTFRPGKMLKRLLVLLLRSKQRFGKSRVNESSQKVLTKEDIEKNKAFLANLIAELGQKFTLRRTKTG